MGNKLIFIGPPGAGKTTLRKIFFEGENTKKLLEYALEPTYGEESIILRLPKIHEEIGIFDLAGQENERWLESEERAIFLDTNIILGVMDVTAEIDAIIEFITKILKIRNEVTPSAFVYILLHKIDLISFKKLERLKDEIKFKFIDAKQTKFFFTSLKREFFYQTFSCFLQIIKKSISTEEEGESTAILNVLEENFNLIKIIDEEIIISKEELARKLNKPVAIIDILLRNLEKKGYVKVENVENQKLISLTDEGKNNNKNIYTTLLVFPENITGQISIEEKEVAKKEKYPFIGAFV
ncbi:MAG: ADP-ribosylation factor-like protein, partial [Promethearchaeota archaeon]